MVREEAKQTIAWSGPMLTYVPHSIGRVCGLSCFCRRIFLGRTLLSERLRSPLCRRSPASAGTRALGVDRAFRSRVLPTYVASLLLGLRSEISGVDLAGVAGTTRG